MIWHPTGCVIICQNITYFVIKWLGYSILTAGIEFVGVVPQVTWSPNLNTNGIERTYTIWGKTNLTDGADWECPTNAAHRFFKVTVEMP